MCAGVCAQPSGYPAGRVTWGHEASPQAGVQPGLGRASRGSALPGVWRGEAGGPGPEGQPTLASPGPRHRRGQSVNSQARLWVLGALVHPWLLSRQDFPGIRCCLGNPVGRSHVRSALGRAPRSVLTPSPAAAAAALRGTGSAQGVGVPRSPSSGGSGRAAAVRTAPSPTCWFGLACGLRWGWGAATRQGHLPCSLWPRFLLGVLGVPGGQHLPGKVWRDQAPIPATLATRPEPAPRGRARMAAPGAHRTRALSAGLPWEGLSSGSSRGLGSQEDGHGTVTVPESLAEGPREAWEDRGFMAGAPWAPQSCLTGHTSRAGHTLAFSGKAPAAPGRECRHPSGRAFPGLLLPRATLQGQAPREASWPGCPPHSPRGLALPSKAHPPGPQPTLMPWSPCSPGLPASPAYPSGPCRTE